MTHRDKKYPYYDIPDLWTLRELVQNGKERGADVTAFYRGRNNDIPLTFGEVSDLVRGAGEFLLDQGFSGSNIALIGENSTEWILSFLAVMNSGNVAVPLDRGLKSDEITELAVHCECRAVFYSDKCSGIADELKKCSDLSGVRYYMIDDIYVYAERGKTLQESGHNVYDEIDITRDDLASIVYTSGTSGKMKGVMLTHGNLTSDVVATGRCAGGESTQLLLPLHHTFAWASAVLMIFIYITDLHISGNLRHIVKDLQHNRPQNVSTVPMMAEMLYNSIWSNARRAGMTGKLKRTMLMSNVLMKLGIDRRRQMFRRIHENFGGRLELMICGGAALDTAVQRGLYSLGINVICGYGITECSPVVSVNRNNEFRFGSVGKPLPCNRVKIADPDRRGIGEICVAGSNVMKGYYKDPEATAEAFDGEWFRTGDYGRLDADGFLYITGRKKNLIILANGENVMPEELEQKLKELEYIEDVVCYEENGKITAEFYLDEENFPDARIRLEEDVKKFNRSMPKHKNIGNIKIRDIPFEKTSTMKIKRYLLKQDKSRAK